MGISPFSAPENYASSHTAQNINDYHYLKGGVA